MQQAGYYDVKVDMAGKSYHHIVFASSDYAAAVKVRKTTGYMARRDSDVAYISKPVLVRQAH